jgi:hypothetical protein
MRRTMEIPPMTETRHHDWPRCALHVFGMVFCAVLGASMLLFPILKHRPSGLAPVAGGLLLSAVILHGRVRRRLSQALLAPRRGRFLLATVTMFPSRPRKTTYSLTKMAYHI